jgi:GxxExxY protein
MHPLFAKTDTLSSLVIGAAIEVHRELGSGLLESYYERCLLHELQLQKLSCTSQKQVQLEYKGLIIAEPLRFDVLVEGCLLIEIKAVELILPIHKAQLMTYMRLLNVPLGLLINFHEPLLKNGLHRMILSGANK